MLESVFSEKDEGLWKYDGFTATERLLVDFGHDFGFLQGDEWKKEKVRHTSTTFNHSILLVLVLFPRLIPSPKFFLF